MATLRWEHRKFNKPSPCFSLYNGMTGIANYMNFTSDSEITYIGV